MHQAHQAVAAEIQSQAAGLRRLQPGPDQPPRQRNEFYFFAQPARDFQSSCLNGHGWSCAAVKMRGAISIFPAANFSMNAAQILVVNEKLDLRAAADHRNHGRLADLRDEFAEHPARPAAINQSRPDYQRAAVQRDLFNLQFRLAVKRAATVKGADGGNADDFRPMPAARAA